MDASNALHQLGLCPNYNMLDPGDAGTINVTDQLRTLAMTTAGAETRTLAAPPKAGLYFVLKLHTYVGAATVTVLDTAGSTTYTLVFGAAAQWVLLHSIEASTTNLKWVAVNGAVTSGFSSALTGAASVTTLEATDLATLDAGITFAGATGVNVLTVPTNLASGLSMVDSAAAPIFVLATTTGSPAITWGCSVVFGAGITASGAVANDFSGSTGAFKTSTGLNTFGGNTAHKVGATVTAAGSSQSDAVALNEGDVMQVTGVTGHTGYGVKFPSASVAGMKKTVINVTAYACVLYPYGTEDIGAGASTAITIAGSTAYDVIFTAQGVGRAYSKGARVVS